MLRMTPIKIKFENIPLEKMRPTLNCSNHPHVGPIYPFNGVHLYKIKSPK